MRTLSVGITVGEARRRIGGLSKTEKMPCYSWSIPRKYCKRGSKLAKIPGTVCNRCYAGRGRYVFPNVEAAQERRYRRWLETDPKLWVYYFSVALKGQKYFRWFDSGDLQSVEMLRQIARVAELTPFCQHRLPTREVGMVRQYLDKYVDFPPNLWVTISMDGIGEKPNVMDKVANGLIVLPMSGVVRKRSEASCRASLGKKVCGPCRLCWQGTDVTYLLH